METNESVDLSAVTEDTVIVPAIDTGLEQNLLACLSTNNVSVKSRKVTLGFHHMLFLSKQHVISQRVF